MHFTLVSVIHLSFIECLFAFQLISICNWKFSFCEFIYRSVLFFNEIVPKRERERKSEWKKHLIKNNGKLRSNVIYDCCVGNRFEKSKNNETKLAKFNVHFMRLYLWLIALDSKSRFFVYSFVAVLVVLQITFALSYSMCVYKFLLRFNFINVYVVRCLILFFFHFNK